MPGGSNNQERKSFLHGNRRVTVDATNGMPRVVSDGHVAPSAAPIVSESGQPQQIRLVDGADCANILYHEPQPLGLYAYINTTGVGQTSFLFDSQIVAAPGIGARPPVGGLVPVGRLIFGHAGVSQSFLFNVTVGSMEKAVFLGSSARFGFSVYPRYFYPDDTGATRKYLVGNPAAVTELTNEMWNTPKASALVSQAYRYIAESVPGYEDLIDNVFDPNLRAVGLAHFGYGQPTSAGINRPKRVFYGTLKPGAAYSTRTRCPVAYNATSVMLVGGRQLGAANFRVQMIQQPNPAITDPAINSLEMGAQASDIEVPFTAGNGWIYVTSPDATGASTEEIPFEIHYYLGL